MKMFLMDLYEFVVKLFCYKTTWKI